MSLESSPEALLRPEDKVLKMLYPAADQPLCNSFDDFFNQELYDNSQEDAFDIETSDRLSLLTFDNYEHNIAYEQPQIKSQAAVGPPPQPWRKGLWCLSQTPLTQQLVIGKTRKVNDAPSAIVPPSCLFSNDNFAVRSPRSFTQPARTKSSSPVRSQLGLCENSVFQQSPTLNMLRPPASMCSNALDDRQICYIDAWQQDSRDKTLKLQDNFFDDFTDDAFAPPDSAYVTANVFEVDQGYSERSHSSRSTRLSRAQMVSAQHRGRRLEQQDFVTAMSDHSATAVSNADGRPPSRNIFCEAPDQDDVAYRFINEELPPLSDWTSQSPSSSNNSQNSHPTTMSSELPSEMLCNDLATSWPLQLDVPSSIENQDQRDSFPILAQPKPRRVTHNVLRHEQFSGGYEAAYSPYEIGVALPYHPAEMQNQNAALLQAAYVNSKSVYTNALTSYPSLPPPSPKFADTSPFTTPRRRQARALSRSPSPTTMPGHKSGKSNRSPSRHETGHRRKSIHKPGPVRDTCPETPRHRSTSRPPRTPKTPRTPGDAFSLDFVNFTPKDASKLLNDVAPSGSSKTRARREQEAREKRKKMSEAAFRAVRNAGGDVEALERAIFS